MFQAVIAAVAGAVVGGVVNGVTTAITTENKVAAYKQAAQQVKDASNKYSGEALYRNMVEAGKQNAEERNNQVKAQDLMKNVDQIGTNSNSQAQLNQQGYNDVTTEAFDQAANRTAGLAKANYDRETARANQLMKQADIDYNVANQAVQSGLNAVGGGIGTAASTIDWGKGKQTN